MTRRTRLLGASAAVLSIGIGPGWWMFGVRGAGLFAVVAGLLLLMCRLACPRSGAIGSALALTLAACAMQYSATLGWGGADAADGTRYKASPVGLSHVLTPDRVTSETEDCRWYATHAHMPPCGIARGGEASFARLRTVYPLALLSAAMAAAGALISSRRRLREWQRALAGCSGGAALLALLLFDSAAGEALAPLVGLRFGVGGTLGVMCVCGAILLNATVAAGPLPRGENEKAGDGAPKAPGAPRTSGC